jgi:MFS family permease
MLPNKPAYEPTDDDRPASSSPDEATLESEVPGGSQQKHDPYLAWRLRDYRLYAVGGLIGALGSQMFNVAVGWELYERTNSAWALGMVGLVQALPVIGLALPAGHLADRHDRRIIFLIAQFIAVLLLLFLTFLSYNNAPVSWFYIVLGLQATSNAISGPARVALLPQLVPVEALANAVTWNSSRFQFASTIGPALGGFAIAIWQVAWPIYLIATLAALILGVFLIPLKPRPVERQITDESPWQSLSAGVRFVRGNPIILATITLDMFAVLLGGATMLLPIFAKDILHVGPQGLGWLRAAPAVGALAMGLTLAHLPPMRRAGHNLLWAVIGFGLATIVFGLSKNFWLSFLMLALTGAFDNVSVVVRHTLVQVLTPPYMQGRVSAVNSVFIGSSNQIGEFESGVAATFLGPVVAVVAGGIGTILVVLGAAAIWPQIKALGSLEDAAREGQS